MLIRPWKQRTQEAAYLFNPPFCCAVLTSAVGGYLQEDHRGMPFPLAYLALPAILHKHTREKLPLTVRTSLAAWMEENPDLRIQFYERAVAMKPFVGEGIIFGIQSNWLVIDAGKIKSSLGNLQIKKLAENSEGEARYCMQRAQFLGRWFALAGTPETVMALWEVKP